MRILCVLVLTFLLTGCGKDSVNVIHNNDVVSELEKRLTINEQLDAARDVLIDLNTYNIQNISQELESVQYNLTLLIEEERQARVNGDARLLRIIRNRVAVQSLINSLVQIQILSLNSSISDLTSQVSSIQSQVDSISSNLDSLLIEVNNINIELANLQDQIDNIDLIALEDSILDQVEILVGENSVEVVKPCSNSAEVLLLIDGVLYGTMNHTTGNSNNGVLKSVALEPLNNGTYATTSSSGNCTFTVTNGTIN